MIQGLGNPPSQLDKVCSVEIPGLSPNQQEIIDRIFQELRNLVATQETEIELLTETNTRLDQKIGEFTSRNNLLNKQYDTLASEKKELLENYEALKVEKEAAQAEKERLLRERDQLLERCQSLKTQFELLGKDTQFVNNQSSEFINQVTSLINENKELRRRLGESDSISGKKDIDGDFKHFSDFPIWFQLWLIPFLPIGIIANGIANWLFPELQEPKPEEPKIKSDDELV